MFVIYFLLIISWCVQWSVGVKNLRVAYEWKTLDFEFPSSREHQQAIARKVFIPENNLPLGIEVFRDKLFVTVPRWKNGVPASLTYINMSDPSSSPKLRPYPNWAAHQRQLNPYSIPPEIVSPFRIRADKCGRLWVLDSGEDDIKGESIKLVPPTLLVYDLLNNDALIRRYRIPLEQLRENSFFASIAVEDHNCEDSYAYLADLFGPQLVVYSWKKRKSWRIKHHYFNLDPLYGNFNVSNQTFQWDSGLFGLALSAPTADGFSTLYFHPFVSGTEFSIDTRYLRNPTTINDAFHRFQIVGSRGPKGESGASFLDQRTGVLFFTLPNRNALGCWKTSREWDSWDLVHEDEVAMVFPNDVKVDERGRVWVISDRMPEFLYKGLRGGELNFRVFVGSVEGAVEGTTCEEGDGWRKRRGKAMIGKRSGSERNFTINWILCFVLQVMLIRY